jgi:hypothetical protein
MIPKLQRRAVWISILLSATLSAATAQTPSVSTGAGFMPGARELFAMNFTEDPVGDFPKRLKYVRGPLEIVERDGGRMLRSTGPGEFLINFTEPLPERFTLEFDIVARNSNCCSGEELAVEGTPLLSRSATSAQVMWHHQYLAILGGGMDMGSSTVKVPEGLQDELNGGQLATVQMEFDGARLRLYTNRVRLYNLPEVLFKRGRVLRVFLGGVDDGQAAVYLARIRVAEGDGAAVAVTPPASAGAAAADSIAVRGPAPAPIAVVPVAPATGTVTPMPAPPPPPPASPGVATPVTTIATPTASLTPASPGAIAAPSQAVAAESRQPLAGRPLAEVPMAPSVCRPSPTSPGRAPSSVTLGQIQSPVGAQVVWRAVYGAAAYVVDRSADGSGTWVEVTSTCTNPDLQSQLSATDLQFIDRTGGIAQRTKYSYRITAVGSGGQSGWNSVTWTAPSLPTMNMNVPVVTGSTVRLRWDLGDTDPVTGKYVVQPTDFLITSTYGFRMVKSRGSFTSCGCYVEIFGVPEGAHTFTVTERWPPDVTFSRNSRVQIKP